MVRIPPPKKGPPYYYAWESITTKKPLKLMVDTKQESLNVQQAASRWGQRHGVKLATRTESVGGRIQVTVYREGKRT
jgi:hypothetical protein